MKYLLILTLLLSGCSLFESRVSDDHSGEILVNLNTKSEPEESYCLNKFKKWLEYNDLKILDRHPDNDKVEHDRFYKIGLKSGKLMTEKEMKYFVDNLKVKIWVNWAEPNYKYHLIE